MTGKKSESVVIELSRDEAERLHTLLVVASPDNDDCPKQSEFVDNIGAQLEAVFEGLKVSWMTTNGRMEQD